MAAASFHTFAFWMFLVFPLIVLAFHEIGQALDRRERRIRREGWRAHRAHLDSLEPRRWLP